MLQFNSDLSLRMTHSSTGKSANIISDVAFDSQHHLCQVKCRTAVRTGWSTKCPQTPFCSPWLHQQDPSSSAGAALPMGDAIPATGWAGRALCVPCAAQSLGQGHLCCSHLVTGNFLCFSFAELVWNWKLAFLGLGLHQTFYSHTFS